MTKDESAYVYIECYFDHMPLMRGVAYTYCSITRCYTFLNGFMSHYIVCSRYGRSLPKPTCCKFSTTKFVFHAFCGVHLLFLYFYYPPILFPYLGTICIIPFFVLLYIFFCLLKNRTKLEHHSEGEKCALYL